MNCIRKEPTASHTGEPAKAHKGMMGMETSVAMTIARRRPMRSESEPKVRLPQIAPIL
jgi:hypothetical protein